MISYSDTKWKDEAFPQLTNMTIVEIVQISVEINDICSCIFFPSIY